MARLRPQIEEPINDMDLLRKCIAETLVREKFNACDFETINFILTLKRTAAELENKLHGYFKQADLSPGRLNVLMALYGNKDRPMALSEIGDYLVVTRPNITGLIDGLVDDGLVKRVNHPDDRRLILAQLTDRGKEFVRKFVPHHHRVVASAMSVLTKAEKRQLVQVLDKLRAHLKEVEVPELERFSA